MAGLPSQGEMPVVSSTGRKNGVNISAADHRGDVIVTTRIIAMAAAKPERDTGSDQSA
ncbi:MAG: hypothetical protein ABTS16_06815 [Candidatus Accumulibacter phosphatis]|uniref:hypothetical protein n=1 Tax=Candidatus Accumulibacter TaxID=327159 RepID=UPI00145F8ACD|nr:MULTISPECIES: hypothetical protein [Candidatus Accumulibacter]MBL8407301.1 hypothetical protein [Accumulibacter sp.]HRF10876.1 hypothetical protein [Candidatus Accumulibacter phosphatis]